MKKFISFLILSIACSTYLLADVFMTELTDPQNSSDAGRYVELHNNGDAVVDLAAGWTVQRWTNANADPTASSIVELAGTITPGGFFIICNDADKFALTYGGTCDQDIGTGGFADSNGDDNMALLLDGLIVDMFGVAGEDGTGTGHEFEDGRAERAASNTLANGGQWDASGWNIDNDSGGGDGNQYAPEGFDPGEWIGAGDAPSDVYGCMDVFGLNYNSEATVDDGGCEYADLLVEAGNMYFSPDTLVIDMGQSVQWNNTGGTHDVVFESGPELFGFDTCDGPCLIGSWTFNMAGTYNYICSVGNHAAMGMTGTVVVIDPTVNVTFSVDMSIEGVVGDVKVRTSTMDGDYNPSDWYVMDDSDGDLVYTHTMSLLPGIEYGYNFNNSDGSGYESGSGLGDCAGGNYGNDRYVTPDGDMTLDTVCWESCDACPAIVEGCTDETATNYDSEATVDDGSCEYEEVEAANLFISEAAEGSSNNKYIEIYNASDSAVDLSAYAYPTVSNAPSTPGVHEYWNTFADSAIVAPGDVYVVCHGSADSLIVAECDETYTYLSNGDDGLCLAHGSEANYTFLDCVGDFEADPGSGWEVAGVSNGTKDHTIVRKASVTEGAGYDWATSAGTDADNSQWVVLDQNTWDYLGSHPHEFDTTVYVDVTFNIDMSGVETSPDGVFIAGGGTFGFPGDNPMSDDDGDDIWTFTTSLAAGSGTDYTFLNGNCSDWSCKENITGQDCAVEPYNDRHLDVGEEDMTVNGCFAVCGDGDCSELEPPATFSATFEVGSGGHSCGQINVQGSWDWGSPWGAQLIDDDGDGVYTGSLDAQFSLADGATYEYVFLCVDSSADYWWEDVFGNSYTINAPQGSACDFNPTDGWANYGFVVDGADVHQTYCAGSCDAACDSGSSCGDGACNGDETCSTCPEDCGECEIATVTFDLDGLDDCGFVSVTGTWDGWSGWGANTDTGMAAEISAGDHEFVILCVNTVDGWWYDIWGNSTIYNAPIDGACWNGDATYANYTLSVGSSDMTVSYCAGTCDETCEAGCTNGDVNGDEVVNVQDVVMLVGYILEATGDAPSCSDMNGDGNTDVLDVVTMVSIILDGRITSNATEASLNINDGIVSLDANGFVGAVQMTLSHGAGFDIELTNKAMVADYRTNGNSTTLIIVAPESDELFTASGDFNIEEIIVANEDSQVTVGMPTELTLSEAYPNPFNPSTSLSVYVPADGIVSLSVYNVMGQEVATIHSGNMVAGSHTVTWNASDMTSGMYFVRAESSAGVAVQKVMLMK